MLSFIIIIISAVLLGRGAFGQTLATKRWNTGGGDKNSSTRDEKMPKILINFFPSSSACLVVAPNPRRVILFWSDGAHQTKTIPRTLFILFVMNSSRLSALLQNSLLLHGLFVLFPRSTKKSPRELCEYLNYHTQAEEGQFRPNFREWVKSSFLKLDSFN